MSKITLKTSNSCKCKCIATWWPTDVAPVVLRFNYEATNAPAYKFNNSASDILAISKHLSMIWPNLHCACAETAISELPVKILTLPLDSTNLISYMVW